MPRLFKVSIAVALTALCAVGSRADVITDWNALLRQTIQTDGVISPQFANPGWSTRAMAMMNGALYDVFQANHRTHDPFLVNTAAETGSSLEAALHQAAYEVLLSTYPGQAMELTNEYNSKMASIADGDAKTKGMTLGSSVAQQYIMNRDGDGSADMVMYEEGTDLGEWRSDPFHPGQQAWGPEWRAVQTFAIDSAASHVAALPAIPALDTPEYAAAYNMVKDFGDVNSAVRTEDQKQIGLFWAYDHPGIGPPPVLFIKNIEDIAEQADNSLGENARLFAMASVAMADAAIAAWDAKFEYNFWRPVTAIHDGDLDPNMATDGDTTWRPLGAPGLDPMSIDDDFTPPFPAWTSGHATMGSALFKTLEMFYGTNEFDLIDGIVGDDLFYVLTSEEPGSGFMREYTTFIQDGLLDIDLENSPEGENGMSRIYLGIHWIFDQRDGMTLGRNVASEVFASGFSPVPAPAALPAGLALLGLMGLRRRRAA